MFRRNLKLMLTSAGAVGGFVLMFFDLEHVTGLLPMSSPLATWLTLLVGAIGGGLIGFLLFPLATWTEGRLAKTPLPDILFGAVGLIVGLLIATLVSFTIRNIPLVGSLIAALSALVFGYLGTTIATRKRDELGGLIAALGVNRMARRALMSGGSGPQIRQPKILDTSVIIDGRIADIVRTGFLEGPLVVPSFVLEELRHIADSADALKRNRGRRGLDILNRIQKELNVDVQIHEDDVGDGEVDSKLLKLARQLGGRVVTNDLNLNKVAELQGVPVLNINELANAVKPAVLPGEEMAVTLVKDGKEPGQGVAYLDDGTMIVVDGGRRHIGDTIQVSVTSVLQTAAGRMIFARPRSGNGYSHDRLAERQSERVSP